MTATGMLPVLAALIVTGSGGYPLYVAAGLPALAGAGGGDADPGVR